MKNVDRGLSLHLKGKGFKRMKKIAELRDKDLLGQLGEAHSAPRYKVRAILRNSNGKYAVMYEDSTGLYSLPEEALKLERIYSLRSSAKYWKKPAAHVM